MNLGSKEQRAQARQWHGSAPGSWAVRRFKQVATVREGQVDPEDDQYSALPLFAPNHIESGTGRVLDVETATDQGAESGKYLVDSGDVLYSKIRPALRKVALAPRAGLCSADMYPIKPGPELDARFLFYSMLGEGFFRYSVLESARVAMPKINREALGECVLLIPSLSEQHAIAGFLDRKTAAIDALIEHKERLVAAAEERRAALISEVVLGALSSAKRRDTGTPLGALPEHWTAKRLMYLTATGRPIMYGIVLPGPNVDDGVPIIKSGNCTRETLRPELLHKTTFAIESGYERSRVAKDDIVYAIRGSVGMAALVPEDVAGANLTQDAARIAPAPHVNPRWLLYAVQSAPVWTQLAAGIVGATVKGINIRDLKRPFVPVPPRREQDEIAAHLDAEVGKLHELEAATARSVERLREYRQALITAAVTGQLDIAAQEAA